MIAPAALEVGRPTAPFRGIEAFRYVDQSIFFAREEEARRLWEFAAVYRGVLLYGDSGTGKSSLINAAFVPLAIEHGRTPEVIRVRPRVGEEFLVQRTPVGENVEGPYLSSIFVDDAAPEPHISLSSLDLRTKLKDATPDRRPVLVFEQFEEFVTLFDEASDEQSFHQAKQAQASIRETLIELVRDSRLPVKVVFAFREDYLGKLMELFAMVPNLPNQSLRLVPPRVEELREIVRGPFRRHQGAFGGELSERVAEQLELEMRAHNPTGVLNLSEVQIVCKRLFESANAERELAQRHVSGLLGDYLVERLSHLRPAQREAAVVLLSRLVTAAGTRNVVSQQDLVRQEPGLASTDIETTLGRLEADRLIRREWRREVYFYEIVSEVLIPSIQRERQVQLALLREEEERQRLEQARREFARQRRSLMRWIAALLGLGVLVLAAIGVAALQYRSAQEAIQTAAAAQAVAASQTANAERLQVEAEAARKDAFDARNEAVRQQDAATQANIQAEALKKQAEAANTEAERQRGLAGDAQGRAVAAQRKADDAQVEVDSAQAWAEAALAEVERQRADADAARQEALAAQQVAQTEQRGAAAAQAQAAAAQQQARVLQAQAADEHQAALDAQADAAAAKQVADDAKAEVDKARQEALAAQQQADEFRQVAAKAQAEAQRVASEAANTDRLAEYASSVLTGLPGSVTDAIFSPDGTVAIGGRDGTVQLWRPGEQAARQLSGDQVGQSVSQLSGESVGQSGAIRKLVFSLDGALVVATDDRTARVWDAASGTLLGATAQKDPAPINDAALSPDGKLLVLVDDAGNGMIWPVGTYGPMTTFSAPGAITATAFRPDGAMLAIVVNGQSGGQVIVLDASTWQPRYSIAGSGAQVSSVAFSGDGRLLATARADGEARLYNVQDGKLLQQLSGHSRALTSVAFSPDGAILVTASADGTARTWDTASGKPLTLLAGHKGPVRSAFINPLGTEVVTASDDGSAIVWGLTTGELLVQLRGHTDKVEVARFSYDGTSVVTAGADGSVRVWKIANVCAGPLEGGFRLVWRDPDPRVRNSLGCSLAREEQGVAGTQYFQNGALYWWDADRSIYVFLGDESGRWERHTWGQFGPSVAPYTCTIGYSPMRGFQDLLFSLPAVADALGRCGKTIEEGPDQASGLPGARQQFENGQMLFMPRTESTGEKRIWVLTRSGSPDAGTYVRYKDPNP